MEEECCTVTGEKRDAAIAGEEVDKHRQEHFSPSTHRYDPFQAEGIASSYPSSQQQKWPEEGRWLFFWCVYAILVSSNVWSKRRNNKQVFVCLLVWEYKEANRNKVEGDETKVGEYI